VEQVNVRFKHFFERLMNFLEQLCIQFSLTTINLSRNSALESVTHYTNLYLTFSYVTLVRDLQNCALLFSTVLTVSCRKHTASVTLACTYNYSSASYIL
jgi:hypothetical protein